MEEAKIYHGQEIRADLPNLRVLALTGGVDAQVLFCAMGPIRIREILNRGDDRPLPSDATMQGLHVHASGTYDILNAFVSSNGNLRLVVDDQTRVVPAPNLGPAARVPLRPGRGLAWFFHSESRTDGQDVVSRAPPAP